MVSLGLMLESAGDFFENSVEFFDGLPGHEVEDVSLLIVRQLPNLALVDTAHADRRDLKSVIKDSLIYLTPLAKIGGLVSQAIVYRSLFIVQA